MTENEENKKWWDSFSEIIPVTAHSFWDGLHVGGIIIARVHTDFIMNGKQYYVLLEKHGQVR